MALFFVEFPFSGGRAHDASGSALSSGSLLSFASAFSGLLFFVSAFSGLLSNISAFNGPSIDPAA